MRSAETINQGLAASNAAANGSSSNNFPTKSMKKMGQRGVSGLLNKSEMNIKIAEKSSDHSQ